MELGKGLSVEYVEGALVLKAEVKALVLEELAKIEAKFESGEIDLIKGTDFDKNAAMMFFSAIKAAL